MNFGFITLKEIDIQIISYLDYKTILTLLDINNYLKELIIENLKILINNYTSDDVISFIKDLQNQNKLSLIVKVLHNTKSTTLLNNSFYNIFENETIKYIITDEDIRKALWNSISQEFKDIILCDIYEFNNKVVETMFLLSKVYYEIGNSVLFNPEFTDHYFKKSLYFALEGNKLHNNIKPYNYLFEYAIHTTALRIKDQQDLGILALKNLEKLSEHEELPDYIRSKFLIDQTFLLYPISTYQLIKK